MQRSYTWYSAPRRLKISSLSPDQTRHATSYLFLASSGKKKKSNRELDRFAQLVSCRTFPYVSASYARACARARAHISKRMRVPRVHGCSRMCAWCILCVNATCVRVAWIPRTHVCRSVLHLLFPRPSLTWLFRRNSMPDWSSRSLPSPQSPLRSTDDSFHSVTRTDSNVTTTLHAYSLTLSSLFLSLPQEAVTVSL